MDNQEIAFENEESGIVSLNSNKSARYIRAHLSVEISFKSLKKESLKKRNFDYLHVNIHSDESFISNVKFEKCTPLKIKDFLIPVAFIKSTNVNHYIEEYTRKVFDEKKLGYEISKRTFLHQRMRALNLNPFNVKDLSLAFEDQTYFLATKKNILKIQQMVARNVVVAQEQYEMSKKVLKDNSFVDLVPVRDCNLKPKDKSEGKFQVLYNRKKIDQIDKSTQLFSDALAVVKFYTQILISENSQIKVTIKQRSSNFPKELVQENLITKNNKLPKVNEATETRETQSNEGKASKKAVRYLGIKDKEKTKIDDSLYKPDLAFKEKVCNKNKNSTVLMKESENPLENNSNKNETKEGSVKVTVTYKSFHQSLRELSERNNELESKILRLKYVCDNNMDHREDVKLLKLNGCYKSARDLFNEYDEKIIKEKEHAIFKSIDPITVSNLHEVKNEEESTERSDLILEILRDIITKVELCIEKNEQKSTFIEKTDGSKVHNLNQSNIFEEVDLRQNSRNDNKQFHEGNYDKQCVKIDNVSSIFNNLNITRENVLNKNKGCLNLSKQLFSAADIEENFQHRKVEKMDETTNLKSQVIVRNDPYLLSSINPLHLPWKKRYQFINSSKSKSSKQYSYSDCFNTSIISDQNNDCKEIVIPNILKRLVLNGNFSPLKMKSNFCLKNVFDFALKNTKFFIDKTVIIPSQNLNLITNYLITKLNQTNDQFFGLQLRKIIENSLTSKIEKLNSSQKCTALTKKRQQITDINVFLTNGQYKKFNNFGNQPVIESPNIAALTLNNSSENPEDVQDECFLDSTTFIQEFPSPYLYEIMNQDEETSNDISLKSDTSDDYFISDSSSFKSYSDASLKDFNKFKIPELSYEPDNLNLIREISTSDQENSMQDCPKLQSTKLVKTQESISSLDNQNNYSPKNNDTIEVSRTINQSQLIQPKIDIKSLKYTNGSCKKENCNEKTLESTSNNLDSTPKTSKTNRTTCIPILKNHPLTKNTSSHIFSPTEKTVPIKTFPTKTISQDVVLATKNLQNQKNCSEEKPGVKEKKYSNIFEPLSSMLFNNTRLILRSYDKDTKKPRPKTTPAKSIPKENKNLKSQRQNATLISNQNNTKLACSENKTIDQKLKKNRYQRRSNIPQSSILTKQPLTPKYNACTERRLQMLQEKKVQEQINSSTSTLHEELKTCSSNKPNKKISETRINNEGITNSPRQSNKNPNINEVDIRNSIQNANIENDSCDETSKNILLLRKSSINSKLSSENIDEIFEAEPSYFYLHNNLHKKLKKDLKSNNSNTDITNNLQYLETLEARVSHLMELDYFFQL